jgi:DNA (cytosine-5)-methyltransferase 1
VLRRPQPAATGQPPPLTFVSAFAGIGGFDLALERTGMRCAGQIEIDSACLSVLARHFPEVDRHDDIRTAISWWLARPRPPLDLLCAGFPCQDLSTANTSGRSGLQGGRSGLFHQLARVAGALCPRWLLLENVTGLLHCNQGRDFQAVLDALGQLGYGLAWTVLDAQHHGLAQQRRRVFVAGRRGAPCPFELLFDGQPGAAGAAAGSPPKDPAPADQAAPGAAAHRPPHDPAQHHPQREAGGQEGGAALTATTPPTEESASVGVGPVWVLQAGGWAPLYWRENGPSYTLDTAGRHLLAYTPPGHDQLLVRRFTPTECERLQGFPGGWTATGAGGRPVPEGIRYRMLGNAVAVPVVEAIGRRLLAIAHTDRRQGRP